MAKARVGSVARKAISNLASPEVAKSRLLALRTDMGRTRTDAQRIDGCILDVMMAFTGGTKILKDPRFLRFQRGLKATIAALEEFTPKELASEFGTTNPLRVNAPPVAKATPTESIEWVAEAGPATASPREVDILKRLEALADYLEQRENQGMSLQLALNALSPIHEFFVQQTPLSGPNHSWDLPFFLWQSDKTRHLLKREPRVAVAMLVVETFRDKEQ